MTDALGGIIADLNGLGGFLKYVDGRSIRPDFPHGQWFDHEDMRHADRGQLKDLIDDFAARGLAAHPRAIAGAIMLRVGWAAGLQIGAYLRHRTLVLDGRYDLLFSPTGLLVAVGIRRAEVCDISSGNLAQNRRRLASSLYDSVEPLVVALHTWSRFSEHALLTMAVSSWAAQFENLGQQLGIGDDAIDEAQRVFASHTLVEAAAPKTYRVEAGGRAGWCQKRRLCCLYFKGKAREFCASCPILDEDDRLQRNRAWIAEHGRPLDFTQN